MRRSTTAGALLALFLAAFLPAASAIYREQAEQSDWLMPLVGRVNLAAYAPAVSALPLGTPRPPPVGRSPASFAARTAFEEEGPALFVGSSETRAVAGVDPATGELVWRQFLASAPLALTCVPSSGTLITASSTNGSLFIQAWRGADGAAAWEARPGVLAACTSPALAATPAAVLVACAGRALALDASTGSTAWQVPVPGAGGDALLTAAASPDGSAFALAWPSGSALASARLSSADGTTLDAGSARTGRLGERGVALVPTGPSSFAAAALTADGRRACTADACLPLPDELGACSGLSAPLPGVVAAMGGRAPPALALACEHGAAGLTLAPGGPAALTPPLPGATAAAPVPGASVAGAFVDPETGNVIVSTRAPPSSSSHALRWAAPGCASPSAPAAAWALPPRHSPADDADAVGSLFLVAADGASALVRLARGGGRAIGVTHWSRPGDAVAGAVAALYAPLPPPQAAPSPTTTPTTAKDRLAATLRTEWLAAKAMAGAASAEEAAELRAARAAAGGRGLPTSDAHAFRQAALVLGPAGTLTALHSGDGHVLWRLPGLVPAAEAASARLLPWRTSHAAAGPPTALALWRSGWAAVDAAAGAVLESGSHPFPVDQAVAIPGAVRDGAGGGAGGKKSAGRAGPPPAEQRVFALVEAAPPSSDAAPRWALLPSTPAAAALAAASAPLRWWRADACAGTVTGYVATATADGGAGGTPACGASVVAWRHAFPPSSILAALGPPPSPHPSPTSAVVTGGRDLKVKPAADAWALVVTSDAGGRGLTATVLDAASGQAVFRQAHPGGSGPVAAAWLGDGASLAYAFSGPPPTWGLGGGGGGGGGAIPATARLPPRPWHLATLDIFDARRGAGVSVGTLFFQALGLGGGSGGRGGGGGGGGGGGPAPHRQSAFDPPPIEVERATFAFPPGVSPSAPLTPTRTARGVSPVVLLVPTATGEVLALPRRLIDPRRPPPGDAKAVAAGAAEGLPPYHPSLPAPPTAFATHGARVGGLGGQGGGVLVSAPAALESTALVLAVGVDAWGSRVLPTSSSFDLPPPDFPYGLLAAVSAVTGVGAVLLKSAAGRAAVRAKWE